MKALNGYTFLWQSQGRSIQRIRRIMYVFRGKITAETGPVEFTFRDRNVLLLDAAPDGEALAVKDSVWIDYFTEPLSTENMEFIERSGKWTSFDVSDRAPYSSVIDQIIDEVTAIRTPDNKITGTIIKTASNAMRVEVEADEISVDIA